MDISESNLNEFGFKDRIEFITLITSIDISTSEKLKAFQKWQYEDGTKAGLLKLKEKNNA